MFQMKKFIFLILALFVMYSIGSADISRSLESDTKNLLEIAKGGKVLTFGDSLTAGLHVNMTGLSNFSSPLRQRLGNTSRGSFGSGGQVSSHSMFSRRQMMFHPYGLKLGELMGSEVVTSGLSGESTGNMAHRLPVVLSNLTNVKVVILLGGTNDIGMKFKSDLIISNILSMHKWLHNTTNNFYTIALTVPPINFPFHNHTHRGIVNEGIRKYAKLCSHRVALLELDQIFQPFNSTENQDYWSDRVHFSAKGYDKLGETIYNFMKATTFNVKEYNKLDC